MSWTLALGRAHSLTRTWPLPMKQCSASLLSLRLPNPFQRQTQVATLYSLYEKLIKRVPNHKSDKVNITEKMIYKSSKVNYLYSTYGILGPCVGFTCLQCASFISEIFVSDMPVSVLVDINEHYLLSVLMSMFGVALFGAVRGLVLKSFLRIYYNEDKDIYTGIVLNSFLMKQKVVFQVTDIKEKPLSFLFSEMSGNYYIKGRPFYVVDGDFVKVSYLNKMLGEVPKRGS